VECEIRNSVGVTCSFVLLHLEQRSHRFHPVPQILQAQVCIGGILIIVVVGDGYRDAGSLGGGFHISQRHAPAKGADTLADSNATVSTPPTRDEKPTEAGEPRHLLHVGTALTIAKRQQTDFHLGVGLSSAAMDHFVGIGCSFRFPAIRR
jgi:hypothetical protein